MQKKNQNHNLNIVHTDSIDGHGNARLYTSCSAIMSDSIMLLVSLGPPIRFGFSAKLWCTVVPTLALPASAPMPPHPQHMPCGDHGDHLTQEAEFVTARV
jgi:hypothetical protein